MARNEEAREDLMREATALVERAELRLADDEAGIVVGFRTDGAGTIFIGADLVYQFNSRCELRRAYAELLARDSDSATERGSLIKAEFGRLVALRRQRSPERTWLVRHELGPDEVRAFLDHLRGHFARILERFADRSVEIVAQIPPDADLVARINTWMRVIVDDVRIADVPHVRSFGPVNS